MAESKTIRFVRPAHWTLTQTLEHYSEMSPSGCRLWVGGRHWQGYGVLKWGGKMCRAHRLAWEDANGPIPTGIDVLHKCDVPACINIAHLWLGTDADNRADCVAKGRHRGPRGTRARSARLTEEQVRAIRKSTLGSVLLAREYGVSLQQIWYIRTRKHWAHLPD